MSTVSNLKLCLFAVLYTNFQKDIIWTLEKWFENELVKGYQEIVIWTFHE